VGIWDTKSYKNSDDEVIEQVTSAMGITVIQNWCARYNSGGRGTGKTNPPWTFAYADMAGYGGTFVGTDHPTPPYYLQNQLSYFSFKLGIFYSD
jgi:hypothetical protein